MGGLTAKKQNLTESVWETIISSFSFKKIYINYFIIHMRQSTCFSIEYDQRVFKINFINSLSARSYIIKSKIKLWS